MLKARNILKPTKLSLLQTRAFTYPYVIERDGAIERSYDIFSRLLKDRIVCIMGKFDMNYELENTFRTNK